MDSDRGEDGYFRVANRRGGKEFGPWAGEKVVVMDRQNPLFGNTHVMKVKSVAERDRVIELYRRDLDADFAVAGPKSQALREIARAIVRDGAKVAGLCNCAPVACHVDVIAERVRELVAELKDEISAVPLGPDPFMKSGGKVAKP